MIVVAIRINIARKTTEQKKQTSQTTTRKGRKEVNVEERIQKANGGGWNWKQWRRQEDDGVGRSEGGRVCAAIFECSFMDGGGGPSTLGPCLASRPPGKHFKSTVQAIVETDTDRDFPHPR
jgi:hypothetical protein